MTRRSSAHNSLIQYSSGKRDILNTVTPCLIQRGFFLPCTENLHLFRKNGAEKQPSGGAFLFCGCHVGKDFPVTEDVGENPAYTDVIITNLIIGKSKIFVWKRRFPCFAGLLRLPDRWGARS